MMIVKNNHGTVLDVNTDAVSCTFDGDKLPFQLDVINIKGFYYDTDKLIPKYKIEDKGRLKCARMSNNFRTDKYIHDIKYNGNITPDVEDRGGSTVGSTLRSGAQGPGFKPGLFHDAHASDVPVLCQLAV